MMYRLYMTYFATYLSKESQAIVDASKKLTFHFCYAVWNGAGFFKGFADVLNTQVAAGQDVEWLEDFAVKCRTENSNSLIKQGGEKFEQIYQLPFFDA